ncbi:acyltransferase family protein [Flavobacterium cellulosilyticum]|uniref:Acyltransferase n=1 Tax=Flavobacterium cellulosilyticum TaxID=2541731 RepID=A0A4R5C954_9FLAO|nr:acyltransferase [Flavobacterium cellulosilyticum]TDD94673.1 acyltransferase [Flavobacterium cellulosilyticum]
MNKIFYSKPSFTDSTWALLAITRFLLALVVMISIGHLSDFTSEGSIFNYLKDFGGKTAVMVFLMVSGISVGYSYSENKNGFFKRRFLRIYPLYFMAILGTVILQFYVGSPYHVNNSMVFVAAGNATSIANFLLLQGVVALNIMYNSPVWSLSVEVFLYMMLPIFFILRTRFLYLIVIISLFFYIGHSYLPSISLFGFQHLMYAWPFILGFIITVRKKSWSIIPFILLGTYGIYYNFLNGTVFEKYSYVWFFFSVILIFIILYTKLNLSKRYLTFLNFLGTISYPMYLVHIPLYIFLYHLGIRESYLFVLLVILICIPINYIFDVWFKKIFWKPLVNYIETRVKEFKLKRISNKISKA